MKLVVLCGGSGTRLWPISRTSHPKQFAKIFNKKSLYELTLERNKKFFDGFIIVVNEVQLKLCKEQLPKDIRDKTQFIIEPVARNTAPAISLAAYAADGDDIMVVPSDHLIEDLDLYEKSILAAKELASNQQLVTFGLKPLYPETGFGYIEANGQKVSSFKEKPDFETAKKYVESGNFYWNSGMFYFNSSFYLEELNKLQPDIAKFSQTAFQAAKQKDATYYIQKSDMENIPKDSIDYAIMEKSQNVGVIAAEYHWKDLGSFDSLADVLPKDDSNNTKDENYLGYQSKNNLIISDKKIICTFGVEDLIVVDTEDALLIGRKGQSQDVKKLLESVKATKPELLE